MTLIEIIYILISLHFGGDAHSVSSHSFKQIALEPKEVPEIVEEPAEPDPPEPVVEVAKEEPPAESQNKGAGELSEDQRLIARLVTAESTGEPYEGKVAVARVVLNRVESPEFPDTVQEVIYQSGQFQPVSNGAIDQPASEEAKRATLEAYNRPADDSLFFYNYETASSRWLDSRETTKVIGNHTFKK